jgi:hypothetical protein
MMTPTASTTEDSKESSTFSRLQVGMLLRNVQHRWVRCLLVAGCIELRLTTSFHNTKQCEEVNAMTREFLSLCTGATFRLSLGGKTSSPW